MTPKNIFSITIPILGIEIVAPGGDRLSTRFLGRIQMRVMRSKAEWVSQQL